MVMDCYNRTFGFEFEVADVEKAKVDLPAGYSWSREETIVNSNGHIVKCSAPRGGELNTPPLLLRQRCREEVEGVLTQIFNAGGRCTWCHGFAVHVFAGDLGLEELKRIFLLSYYTSEIILKIADVGEWSEYPNQAPVPVKEYADNARSARTFDELKNVFANSSAKGFIRHMVNISAYFKHQTIEFRIFNSTYDFSEIEQSVMFAMRFVKYAVEHMEEDFSGITSEKEFRKRIGFTGTLARKQKPMLFSGDQEKEEDRYVSRPINIAPGHLKLLVKESGEQLACVNPNLYSTEVSIMDKVSLKIYNVDEFNHLLWRCASGDLKIEYRKDFVFLQSYAADREGQVCCLLLFRRMHRYTKNNEFSKKMLDSMRSALGESIDKAMPVAKALVAMSSKCEYINGTLEDAIAEGNANIFYQYENNSKNRKTVAQLKKYSDYSDKYEPKQTDYYGLTDRLASGQRIMTVSANEFLGMPKIGKIGRQIFYVSSRPEERELLTTKNKKAAFYSLEFPPDNLEITDTASLHIEVINGDCLLQLQKMFVKRVTKFKRAFCSFTVMYDKYCLGAFGFDFSKRLEFDIWMLSDFCTNNSIQRLSKLVLMCTLTEKVKIHLQRSIGRGLETVFSYVYTSHPVSMKYRGVYKKEDDDGRKCLTYTQRLGTIKDEAEVMERYRKMIAKK